MKLFHSRRANAAPSEKAEESSSPTTIPSFASDALQLYVLSAFAVAQPLLDRLGRQVAFLIRQQIDAGGLFLTVGVIMFAVPTAMLLGEWGVGSSLGVRARRRLHRCFRFLLGLCFVLQIQLIAIEALDARAWGIPGLFILGIASAIAVMLDCVIERSASARKAVAYASVGIVLFPLMFFRNSGVREIAFSQRTQQTIQVAKPVPIVMVVFDGLNGMALLDESHEIDAVRYPNFARLAGLSHWFRNATTVHPRTGYAVPAILTGCMPRDVVPIFSEYPDNLFQLLHSCREFEMSVFEPSTHLAPPETARHSEQLTMIGHMNRVVWHLGFVFLHATIPADLPPGLPQVPRSWFNLSEPVRVMGRREEGVFAYSWDVQRRDQFEHFLDCIRESDRPGFRFLHLVMPHHPWQYLPDGESYAPDLDVGDYPPGAHGMIGEDWSSDPLVVNLARQRYLLQLMFVDNLIGQLLDRLESTGLLDECLLVVTADHGEAFIPGLSRREVAGENVSEILPIPLFIKLPEQREGVVSDRNVESIDIFPTIADVIGLELQSEVEGRSIFDADQPPSLRKTFLSNWQLVAVSAEFPERFRSVDRMIALFGTGSRDDRLTNYSFRPELIGQPVEAFQMDEGNAPQVELFHDGGRYDPAKPDVVPCLFEGRVRSFREGEPPITLVIALNGEIVAVTRTFEDELQPEWFTVLAPDAIFLPGDNTVELFELLPTNDGPVLRRCELRYIQS